MKIILEGTEAELRSALHSFGVPDKVVFDDGEKFVELPKRRRNCAVTRLEPQMRNAVDSMLLKSCAYSYISQHLKSLGISISRQAIGNYRRSYFQPPMIKDELIPFACRDLSYKGHGSQKSETQPVISLEMMAENALSNSDSQENAELTKLTATHYRQLRELFSSNSYDKTPEQ